MASFSSWHSNSVAFMLEPRNGSSTTASMPSNYGYETTIQDGKSVGGMQNGSDSSASILRLIHTGSIKQDTTQRLKMETCLRLS